MDNIKIYLQRLRQFKDRVAALRYPASVPLSARYIYDQDAPILFDRAMADSYEPINVGDCWGELWGSAWFRFEGKVPESFSDHEVLALINVDGEGCVFENGAPAQGLTHLHGGSRHHLKRRIPLFEKARGGRRGSDSR